MQKLSNKTAAIMISVLMIISIGAMITQLPKAAGAIDLQTYTFINVAPNPCGVGQTVTVDFWTAVPLQTSQVDTNLTIQITNPDGVVTTQGPYVSDITGGTTIEYAPTMTGNYTFECVFLGMVLTGSTYTGDYDEPSNSTPYVLDVTNTPAPSVLNTPLPTEYWQALPVNAENVNNWYAITGPWMGYQGYFSDATGIYNDSGAYNPYTTGPTSAHILWTKVWCEGGVSGDGYSSEESGDFWTTSQYSPKFGPVIINGILYANWYTFYGSVAGDQGIIAINLYDGQTMWTINTTNSLKCGLLINYETINQYGCVGPWIITTGTLPASDTGGGSSNLVENTTGTDINLYDALTGKYVESIVNGTSPTLWTTDANGNIIGYYENSTAGTEIVHPVEGPAVAVTTLATATATSTTSSAEENARMCAWNMSLCLNFGAIFSTTLNNFIRFELGIMYENPSIPNNITTQTGSSATVNVGEYLGTAAMGAWQIGSGVIVLSYGSGVPSVGETAGYLIECGIDQATGNLLWGPFNRTETPWTRLAENGVYSDGGGVFIDLNMATDLMSGYSVTTGALLWTNTLVCTNGQPVNPYDDYGIQDIVDSTTGVIYYNGLGGDIWAVNMATGAIIWWTCTDILQGSPGTETPYGIWPTWVQWNGVASPGELFIPEGHCYSPPLFHGAQQLCINTTNGALIWKNLGFDTTGGAVAYGVFTTFNAYDGQVYAYGQGPSATTVTAPNVGVTTATPVTISGTVMDVSAGASQEVVKGLFPNGLPCVSDASQEGLMDYAYEQQPLPTNLTGVQVTLTDIDPNGNFETIGTTTTTGASGTFGITWTPPIAGNYTITATFAGSGAYYGSSAVTYMYAGSPQATPAPTSPPITGLASTSTVTLGIAAAVIAIIIAIAIVGILLLRKKP